MARRRNQKSARNVFLAGCRFAQEMHNGRRRGLRYSPEAQAKLDQVIGPVLSALEAVWAETYPEKAISIARHYRRLATKQPRRAKRHLAYAEKLEHAAAGAFA